MATKRNKSLSLLLIATIIFLLLPMAAMAENDTESRSLGDSGNFATPSDAIPGEDEDFDIPNGDILWQVYDYDYGNFDLTQISSWAASGGSSTTAWTWDGTILELTGDGPYTLTGDAGINNLRVRLTCADAELVMDGVNFTNTTSSPAIYFASGGTLQVIADSTVSSTKASGIFSNGILTIDLRDGTTLQVDAISELAIFASNNLTLSGGGAVKATAQNDTGIFLSGNLEVSADCVLEVTGHNDGIQFQGSRTISGAGSIQTVGETRSGISFHTGPPTLTFDFTGDLEVEGGQYGLSYADYSDIGTVAFITTPGNLSTRGGTAAFGANDSGGTIALTNTVNIPGLTEVFNSGAKAFPAIPVSYPVNFGVTGTGGTLTAAVDSSSIFTGSTVAAGKAIVFTAAPSSGYRVKAWKDNTSVVNGTNTIYTVTNITAAHTVTVEFEVVSAVDISTATVSGINSGYTYTGSAITPEPNIVLNGAVLLKGTDYTVSYNNNVSVGTATITISGIGGYTGTLTKNFSIVSGSRSSGSGSSGGTRQSAGTNSTDAKKGHINSITGIITGSSSGYSNWIQESSQEHTSETGAVWKFRYADGTMAAGTIITREGGSTYEQLLWELINGSWYAFRADGSMAVGWVYDAELGGDFYIDDKTGMKTGWVQIDGKWYYLNPNADGRKGMRFVDTWIEGWYVDHNGMWDGGKEIKE